MDAAPIPLERLLAHRAWVRSVARAVARDPSSADDVEQETWVAALATPPRHESSLRGWFGAVVRSRARRAGRTETRRTARETLAARSEAVASPAELAEIADTHRRVVEAVVALDEPYRAAILLRYFEGLPVDEVARRTASPLETTRSRLKRGVAKLRERLSRELGTDERPWHLALAPLLVAPRVTGGASAAGTGGAIVATKATWAAIGLVVAAGAAGVFALKSGDDPKAPPAKDTASAPAAPPAKASAPVAVPRVRAAEPEEKPAAAQPVPAAPKEPEETAAERLKRVKITIDWNRTPIYEALADLKAKSGVDIVVSAEVAEKFAKYADEADIERLQLDQAVPAGQALALLTQLKGLAYVIEEPRVVIVPMGVTRDASKPVVDLATLTSVPKLTVVGRVIDANGAAVPGAQIVRYPGTSEPVATADVAGRFELQLAKPYGSLEAHAPGQIPSFTISVTGEPGAQVTLELATRGAGGSVTVHVVADADGTPLASAMVVVGPNRDIRAQLPDGRTTIDRARVLYTDEKRVLTFDGIAPGHVTVTARLRGYADAVAEADVVAGKTADVTLRLAVKPPIAERLKTQRISFNFQAASLRDVVNFLNQAKQLSIVVDPSVVERAGGYPNVSLELKDVSVAESLDAICRALGGFEWVIDEKSDVVLIRAPKK
jgi:RNA polymerase sigma-70 factor (ECF subfamily)